MLGSAGLGARAIELWTDSIAGAESAPTYASEFCKMMEEVRRDVWAREDAPPRPDTNPHYDRPRSFRGGPTYQERETAQRRAQRQIAKAQAMWEAAAKEETWAAWCGEGG